MNKQLDAAKDWLVFTIDDNYLAVEQSEIVTTVLAMDISGKDSLQVGAMTFVFNDEKWPAFNLNNRLLPSAKVSNKRKYCIVLQQGDKFVGIMCDQIQMLDAQQNLVTSAMPICLKQKYSPFTEIALMGKEIVLIGKVVGLINYIVKMTQVINKAGAQRGRN